MRITPLQHSSARPALEASPERDFLPEAQLLACIRKERERSDRSGATLSLVSLRLPELQESYDPGLDYALESVLRRIRSLDEAGWLETGVLGILLPETTQEGAWALAKDLKRNDTTGYLRGAAIEVYTYPDRAEGPGAGDGRRDGGERRQPRSARQATSARKFATDEATPQPLVQLLLDREPWWKRPLDIAGASLALALLSPVMLAAGVAVACSSPGPVFYSSWRVGKGGRKFRFHKFRTMCADAERKKQELLAHNEASGPVFKMARDPRVTPIGRILRKTSIDELPQFWNVLKGDMSLVGPRPPIPEETVWYAPWQRRRLELKGGLTCLWQISGRSNVSFEEWCRLDVKYHENRSFLGDLAILFRTVPAVLTARGAR